MQDLDKAIEEAIGQVKQNLPAFRKSFKFSYSEGLFYSPIHKAMGWTDGFWPGELHLAYELTGDERYEEAAGAFVPLFLHRIEKRIEVDHHDMGFLYCPTCVADYKLTGNGDAEKAALLAADNLCSRYRENGRFIQCWGTVGDRDNYRCIIDSLLNIPLLFWAYAQTGHRRYRMVAIRHFETVASHIVRDDGSTYQSYFFDPDTGAPIRGATHQGYSDSSTWARGQAWAIYGSALAYRATGDASAKSMFFNTLTYFLDHLPEDDIPYWDLYFSTGSEEPRDASALAIAICGMLEMERLPETGESGKIVREQAKRLAHRLYRQCAVHDPGKSNGQLLHCTYSRKSPHNTCSEKGVDECTAWGDYFYLETLLRLKNPHWDSYW